MKYIVKSEIPLWHEDFGDPYEEAELLDCACSFLKEINSALHFSLDCYEEGYMRILMFLDESSFGEIHVVDKQTQKIGLFKEHGIEMYFHLD